MFGVEENKISYKKQIGATEGDLGRRKWKKNLGKEEEEEKEEELEEKEEEEELEEKEEEEEEEEKKGE